MPLSIELKRDIAFLAQFEKQKLLPLGTLDRTEQAHPWESASEPHGRKLPVHRNHGRSKRPLLVSLTGELLPSLRPGSYTDDVALGGILPWGCAAGIPAPGYRQLPRLFLPSLLHRQALPHRTWRRCKHAGGMRRRVRPAHRSGQQLSCTSMLISIVSRLKNRNRA